MYPQKWIRGARMFMGFLVAPAMAPLCSIALIAVAVRSREVDCPAGLVMFAQGVPAVIAIWYVCATVLGLPYVLWMQNRGDLSLWTIMAPVLGLACPLAVLLFAIGATAGLFIGAMAAVWLPGIVLSALCFYFIAVWQPSAFAQKRL